MIPNKNLQIDSAKMPHYLKKRYNLNKIMDIICPALAIEEKATKENIAEIIPKLAGKDDPFLILAKTEMDYMQTL